MKNYSPPRGKTKSVDTKKASKSELPNAVDPKTVSVLIARKRHMSGLMCPPMGVMPADAGNQNQKH